MIVLFLLFYTTFPAASQEETPLMSLPAYVWAQVSKSTICISRSLHACQSPGDRKYDLGDRHKHKTVEPFRQLAICQKSMLPDSSTVAIELELERVMGICYASINYIMICYSPSTLLYTRPDNKNILFKDPSSLWFNLWKANPHESHLQSKKINPSDAIWHRKRIGFTRDIRKQNKR